MPVPTVVLNSVESQRLKTGVLLFLPLCPSTNARMGVARMGNSCRQLLTSEARNYIKDVGTAFMLWRYAKHIRPIQEFTYVDLWFVLPRTNCDAHNYGKVLFDAMEHGGLVTNDKFILPRYQGIAYDPINPVIIMKLPGEVMEK